MSTLIKEKLLNQAIHNITREIEFTGQRLLLNAILKVCYKEQQITYKLFDIYKKIEKFRKENSKRVASLENGEDDEDWFFTQMYWLDKKGWLIFDPDNARTVIKKTYLDFINTYIASQNNTTPTLSTPINWNDSFKEILEKGFFQNKIYSENYKEPPQQLTCDLPGIEYSTSTKEELEEEFLNQPLACLQYFEWFNNNESESLLYRLWLKNGGNLSYLNVKECFSQTLHTYFSRKYFADCRNTPAYRKALAEEILHQVRVIARDKAHIESEGGNDLIYNEPDFSKIFGAEYYLQ